ncbi:thiamine pyrophosphate-requiring protein [Aureimonas fodinaquatilis]|uniref:Thiamine pyrophosphate-requiring protein n=1 Tax=Aureimonas fodinaquatilis TaxID=2565783 RepID=A0A5B0DWF7_9HYPH|nr:thiamine pyrophosphate-requiring protein [Aureimonas fodinaquatilis]KAA0969529.1 thiamine pyrophosphate-requiring protein [Aureimonas fodinaquatilis]
MSTSTTQTASDVFLESLSKGGVDVAFSVFGTDHAGLIESWAKHNASDNMPEVPRLVICQHEAVAMNGALGYAHFAGHAQAVIAHVDVGTLNLGAGLHNSMRNRLPVLIFAGISPWTENGERFGGRDHYVHWMQDVADQRGSVRNYVKWEYEVRSGAAFPAAVSRGLQIAHSNPPGAVYMTAAREPLEDPIESYQYPAMPAPAPTVPAEDTLQDLVAKLRLAKAPLLVTTSAGAEAGTVEALVNFAETFVVPVVEIRPFHVNMPADHPLHQGYFTDAKIDLLAQADLIISLDCPIPWVPVIQTPSDDAEVVWIGVDPIDSRIPMRSLRGDTFIQANSRETLNALTRLGRQTPATDEAALSERRASLARSHDALVATWDKELATDQLTVSRLAGLVAEVCGQDALIINETVTNDTRVLRQLRKSKAGTLMGEAGSGLGLGLSAAFGAKLARPDADVVCLQGDGCYVFGSPSAVHWGARAHNAPFLTVIINNGGWRAVARSTAMMHPEGHSARAGFQEGRFDAPLDLARTIEAAGGIGLTATTIDEAREAIAQGLAKVREGVSVVVNAHVTD